MLRQIDRALALRTTIHLFLCIGFISAIAFILSAHWLLVLAALPVCAFAWFVLYNFEKGIALWSVGQLPDIANSRPEPHAQSAGASADNSTMRGVPAKAHAPVTIAWPELLQ